MTALATASSNCKRPTHPLIREDVHKGYDRKGSDKKKSLVVILNWLDAKMK
jgi:hypothetical protein